MPSVSIILPTYNSIAFLKERVDTILGQTHKNWECIVVDGNSTDGTWAYLKSVSETDARFKLHQQPPQGVYPAWNMGIELAKGDYIYIATSDDTMQPDCLQKLVNALEQNPDCGIAQCALTIIDEHSRPHSKFNWTDWPKSKFAVGGKNLNQTKHKRLAPYDGFLYAVFETVYSSITQILIKKSVFEKIGLFDNSFGVVGDFEWGLRAGLVTNVIYFPEYLATWRMHTQQLTSNDANYYATAQHKAKVVLMIRSAVNKMKNLEELGNQKLQKLLAHYSRSYLLIKYPGRRNILSFWADKNIDFCQKFAYFVFLFSNGKIQKAKTLQKEIKNLTATKVVEQ